MCARYKNGQNLLFTQPNGRTMCRYLILSDEEIDRLSRYQSSRFKFGDRSVVSELLGKKSIKFHVSIFILLFRFLILFDLFF